ncbi:hypothetical protein PHYSODRAFT_454270, partial [Phytophthora sojae]
APPRFASLAIYRLYVLPRAVLGSLECSSLGPPPQIPRGPASRAICCGYAPHNRSPDRPLTDSAPSLE